MTHDPTYDDLDRLVREQDFIDLDAKIAEDAQSARRVLAASFDFAHAAVEAKFIVICNDPDLAALELEYTP